MSASIKIILRTDYTKTNGQYGIYLRLTLNRKVKNYSLKISVPPVHWDSARQRIKKPGYDSERSNNIIDKYYNRANEYCYNCRIHDKPFSLLDFEQCLFTDKVKSISLFDFIENDIKLTSSKLAPDYIRTLETQISKLRQFRDPLNLNEIDFNFLQVYENYMYSKLGNKPSTVNKTLSFIKLVLNKAIQQDIIKDTPFKNYHLSKAPTNRAFLTMTELDLLQQLYNKNSVTGNQKKY